MADYNLDLERHVLAAILVDAGSFADVSFLAEKDFSPLHRAIFAVLKARVEKTEVLSTLLVAEALKSFGVSFENVEPYQYLESLSLISVKKEEVESLGKAIKKKTVLRELTKKCDDLKAELKGAESKPFNQIIGMVDKTLAEIDKDYYQSESELMFDSLIDEVEEQGNNIKEYEELGYQGPFPSLNFSAGPLVFPGSLVCVGARQGSAKSQFGFFNMLWYLEKNPQVVVCWLDTNEMTKKQLQMRAVCAMSKGNVTLGEIYTGQWRRKKELVDLLRGDVWPRVKKILPRLHYYNIGRLDYAERVPFIKRFYYKHVGRDQYLITCLDYLKGINEVTKYQPEYQMMGAHIDRWKGFITDEVPSSLWTFVQLNRTGITRNKQRASEMDESDNVFSISDRIIQQATNAFHMRWKNPSELAEESLTPISSTSSGTVGSFGNVKFSTLKGRELLGKDYKRSLMPVKLSDGRFVFNYHNLSTENFAWEDKNDLRYMLEQLGHAPVTIDDKPDQNNKNLL